MKVSNTAERLKHIMADRHLKQVDILRLAQPYCQNFSVKLNKNDLSQYVSGKVEPGQNKLFILGKALNVSEAWLMGFDVPMERERRKTSSPGEKEGGLTEGEDKVLELFRRIPADRQQEALDLLELALRMQQKS